MKRSITIAVLLLFSVSMAFPQKRTSKRSHRATVSQQRKLTNVTTFLVEGVKFEMVKVDGEIFNMGAPSDYGSDAYSDEKPSHPVLLNSYYIGKTEVTQELWQAVMKSNPSNFKGSNLPVEEVSWNDCKEFIKKLNSITGKAFRFPTEAEWEYACRGGNRSKGYKYSGSNNINDVAWYAENSDSTTHAVATKRPNELGIYDMSGNVFEWCWDWYDAVYSSDSQFNPSGPAKGIFRVRRSGCWESADRRCRSICRYSSDPEVGGYGIGLRLAMSE